MAAAGVVVVDARYRASDATAFAVTKTISLTGHDFTVTDARGAAVIQVEATAVFSFLQRGSLFLDSGSRRPVLTVQDSAFSMGTRWAAYGGDSTSRRDLLFVAVKSSPVQLARTKVDVFLAAGGNGNGEQRAQAADFVVRGSYYGGACTVSTVGGGEIARITRQDTAGGALLERHTYTARINPGVDRAFVLALAVILDEMHH